MESGLLTIQEIRSNILNSVKEKIKKNPKFLGVNPQSSDISNYVFIQLLRFLKNKSNFNKLGIRKYTIVNSLINERIARMKNLLNKQIKTGTKNKYYTQLKIFKVPKFWYTTLPK